MLRQKKQKKKSNGFTMIELLSVIVVVAILAVISIVAYNGSQERARNASSLQNIKAWVKTFELYRTNRGEYPRPAGVTYPAPTDPTGFCLGDSFPNAKCRLFNQTGSQSYTEAASAALMADLAAYGDGIPKGSNSPIRGTVGPFILVLGNSENVRTFQITSPFYGSTASVCTDLGLEHTGFINNTNAPYFVTCKYTLSSV